MGSRSHWVGVAPRWPTRSVWDDAPSRAALEKSTVLIRNASPGTPKECNRHPELQAAEVIDRRRLPVHSLRQGRHPSPGSPWNEACRVRLMSRWLTAVDAGATSAEPAA